MQNATEKENTEATRWRSRCYKRANNADSVSQMEAIFLNFPRSTVSHASFSQDAVDEHFNKSVLTSPSTAILGLKFI